MKNKLEKISNYIFYTGVIVAVYGLYKSFISTRGLPPGVCPIEDNRPKIYLALVLLLASVIISFINDKKYK
ncbi:MAG: hypothetical protein GX968_00110 [Tissierellia bacterium]|nr:hypothetical protein [Tissierellia bacterium]